MAALLHCDFNYSDFGRGGRRETLVDCEFSRKSQRTFRKKETETHGKRPPREKKEESQALAKKTGNFVDVVTLTLQLCLPLPLDLLLPLLLALPLVLPLLVTLRRRARVAPSGE